MSFTSVLSGLCMSAWLGKMQQPSVALWNINKPYYSCACLWEGWDAELLHPKNGLEIQTVVLGFFFFFPSLSHWLSHLCLQSVSLCISWCPTWKSLLSSQCSATTCGSGPGHSCECPKAPLGRGNQQRFFTTVTVPSYLKPCGHSSRRGTKACSWGDTTPGTSTCRGCPAALQKKAWGVSNVSWSQEHRQLR